MIRKRRIYYKTAVYHVTFRGNNRLAIFKDTSDKEEFLRILSRFKERFQYKIYGLCLMDNHAHLIIEVASDSTISRVMQSILLSYSFNYRRKYKYLGHVFQGRFNSNVIQDEAYFVECLEYIHENPVKANMVDEIGQYPWSSYCFCHEIENKILEGLIKLDKYGDSSFVSLTG